MISHKTAANRMRTIVVPSVGLLAADPRPLCCRNNAQHGESLTVVVVGNQTINFNQISGLVSLCETFDWHACCSYSREATGALCAGR
jgi:hypothetical protein